MKTDDRGHSGSINPAEISKDCSIIPKGKNNEKELLIKNISTTVKQLMRAIEKKDTEYYDRFGLTAPQGLVIFNLKECGPLSPVGLSRKMCVSPSNMTGIINRLERKGWIERIRKNDDRRGYLIRFTQQGLKMSREISDPIEKKIRAKLAKSHDKDLRSLTSALNTVFSVFQKNYLEFVNRFYDNSEYDTNHAQSLFGMGV